ncbi:putative translation initiation factor eIF-2B subunit gamma [Dictyocoela muelleri]|nr:putative translation initiation factor eIF-2B subunit gamma [Dictyocoela muelleri]
MYQGVILVGPGQEFFTFNTHEKPHFTLEIFNISILGRSTLWLSECCSEIFILALPCYEKFIVSIINSISDQLPSRSFPKNRIYDLKNLTNRCDISIYFIPVRSYDGTIKSLLHARKYIKKNFIVTKGNIITTIPLSRFVNQNVFTILIGQGDKVLIGHRDNEIIVYDSSFNLNFEGLDRNLKLINNWDTAQIYFFTKEMIDSFDPSLHSMKSLIPILAKKFRLRFCKAYNNEFIRVKTLNDFFEAYRLIKGQIINSSLFKKIFDKNKLSFTKRDVSVGMVNRFSIVEIDELVSLGYNLLYNNLNKKGKFDQNNNIVGPGFLNNGHVINIVAGKNCVIDKDSHVSESILMDDVIIGKGCVIKDSIIGTGVLIPNNSKIYNCKVAPGYVFKGDVHISDVTF